VLRSDVTHLEVAALQCDELGPLFEEVAPVVALECEVARDRVGKLFHHLGADILLREHRGETKLRLILPKGRKGGRCTKSGSSDEELAACRMRGHKVPPCFQTKELPATWRAHG